MLLTTLVRRGTTVAAATLLALTGIFGMAAPAQAATVSPTPYVNLSAQLGMDISWPQCDSIPATGTQAFSIIGVTGGTANSANPCLAEQMAWAAKLNGTLSTQPDVSLYVNTANPGFKNSGKKSPWPSNNTYQKHKVTLPSWFVKANHVTTCSGHENYKNLACAYMYGWQRAWDDANTRGIANPQVYRWWLDVESINSWSTNQRANEAVLEGMTAYFTSAKSSGGLGSTVGLYTQARDWDSIVGSTVAHSNLNGKDLWIPIGAGSYSMAALSGSLYQPFVTGSRVRMIQFIMNGQDYDYVVSKNSSITQSLFSF